MKLSIKDMIYISIFAALMVVGAFIRIPIPYVPITFQVFFCVFAGIFLGSVKGLLSQVIYIILGLIGLPVFTAGGGPDYIFNKTFGFILGFAVCAFVVGLIMERVKKVNFTSIMAASVVGYLMVYIIGDIYMYMILKVVAGIQTNLMAIVIAMIPFMIKDFALLILVAIISASVLPRLRKAGY